MKKVLCALALMASASLSAHAADDVSKLDSRLTAARNTITSSHSGEYSRRSIVAVDMIDRSRADAFSHTALYAAPSSVPGLTS